MENQDNTEKQELDLKEATPEEAINATKSGLFGRSEYAKADFWNDRFK